MTILPSSYHGFFFFFLLTTASLFFVSSAQPNPRNTDPYAYSKFSPSMAVIIVILIAALFFMAFFSIYIRHCATNSTSSSVRLRAAERRAAAAARGLDPSVIDTFPTLVYSMVKDLKIGKSALECAVCLCEFEDDETLRLIPKCDHVFHPDCIDTWLASHTTCPVCRANLVPQPGDENHHENLPSQLRGLDPESQEQQSGEVDQQQQQQQERQRGEEVVQEEPMSQPRVLDLSMRLNRNRTRGSRSGRPRKFPRSHSTGHSLVQPGENTDRFTLRLPDEVRKQIVNRKLNRATSLVLLPSEGSCRRGYRTGSSRGKYYRRLEELEPEIKSDRWGFSKVGPFLSRMSSSVRSLSRSLSIRSVKGTGKAGEGSSVQAGEPEGSNFGSARLPV